MDLNKKIVIIGGGPTGLGAAVRLRELGYTNWILLEKDDRFGGLSATDIDNNGFLWDIGGHVTFSHYQYFDDVINYYVKDWVNHNREAWIWDRDRFIPYPFQNNIHRLKNEDIISCVNGLIDAQKSSKIVNNFKDWLLNNFGVGIYNLFLGPYNSKVWARSTCDMSADWVGERVSDVNIKKIIENIITKEDDVAWGPNSTFQFPLHGGTGSIWNNIGNSFESNVHLNSEVIDVNMTKKEITYIRDGKRITETYDYLINTMPLDLLFRMSDKETGLQNALFHLEYNSTTLVGLGLRGDMPEELKTKCWMYFPNPEQPFYRCTVFSNYSENNVPSKENWSLMFEITEDHHQTEDSLIRDVLIGARKANLFYDDTVLMSSWVKDVKHGYPIPLLWRDSLLHKVQHTLVENDIYSRGRFGGFKYEVGNMDHSFMQGVEAIDNIVFGREEITYFHPDIVNKGKSFNKRHFSA